MMMTITLSEKVVSMSDAGRMDASGPSITGYRLYGFENQSTNWAGGGTSSTNKANEDIRMNILQEADNIVNGDRQKFYGHPSDNHGCTALMWSGYLSRRYGIPINLDVRDVCWLNALQKISRDANSPKRDNLVDVAGYAANIEMDEVRQDSSTDYGKLVDKLEGSI
jgi:hypothetical protein